jgi:hypothetical protein
LTTGADGTVFVRGVIGGREGGGCYEYRSHTSPFSLFVANLISRAERGVPSDSVGPPPPDGCASAEPS